MVVEIGFRNSWNIFIMVVKKHTFVECIQKDNIENIKLDITEIKDDVKKLHSVIEGNGQMGMRTDMALIKQTVGEIREKVSGNTEVRNEIEITRRVKDRIAEQKNLKFSKTMKIIGLIFVALSLIISLIINFTNFGQTIQIKDTIESEK